MFLHYMNNTCLLYEKNNTHNEKLLFSFYMESGVISTERKYLTKS